MYFYYAFLLGWEEQWKYYFCECKMQGNGGRKCKRNSPNRPANCPDIKKCLNTVNPPMFCFKICEKKKPPPRFCQNFAPKSMAVTELTQKTIVTTVTSSPRHTRVLVVDRGSDDACSLTAHVFILVIVIVFYVAFV